MGIGDWVSGVFGSENKAFANTPEVDPNAYQYGGHEGGAAATAGRYQNTAEGAQSRQGTSANYRQADASRAGQQTLASAMQDRALGQTPSIAQMQADRQMQQASAAQASQSAGARGAGGMALAQQNASNNMANAQGAISGQAQINGANERMQAEQAAFGAYGNMRGQDASQAQFNAQMQDAQRARNDAMTMGMSQLENQVNTTQLGAQMNQQAQQSANSLGAAGINAGVQGQNSSMAQQNGSAIMGMGQSAAGAIAGALADGGKVDKGRPYLVGERGPELVVPKKDGHVIPAEQTHSMLDEEARKAGGAQYRPMDAKRGEQKQTLASVLGSMSQDSKKQSESVDIGYHGPSGAYVPPQLIQISGSRAGGGPMDAGGSYLVGEQGPEMVVPQASSGGMPKLSLPNLSTASVPGLGKSMGGWERAGQEKAFGEGSAISGMGVDKRDWKASPGGVGMNVMAPFEKGNDEAMTQGWNPGQQRLYDSGIIPTGAKSGHSGVAGARAEGGPVSSGKQYLVGEQGPEMVVPLFEPQGQYLQMSPEGRAFYMDKPSAQDTVDAGRPSLAKAIAPSTSQLETRQPVELQAQPPAAAPPPRPAPAPKMAAPKPRKMTDDELMKEAERMGQAMREEHERQMAQGPSVSLASRMGSK